MNKPLSILALSVLFGSPLLASPFAPDDLTAAQRKKLNQFVLDNIRDIRVNETQPRPAMVKEFNDKYTEYCRRRAEDAYKEHGRWFYIEDKKEFTSHHRWDEVVTFRVYYQLHTHYGSLEKIPNYSEENHAKAIRFWQGWQKDDGSWFNAMSGKAAGIQCNGKYVPNIMGLLGCKPLYEHSFYGAAELDVDEFYRDIAGNNLNHGMGPGAVMLTRIHEGKTEFIPILERGIELALTHMSPQTGMFHGPNGNPSGSSFSDYGTTANTMKGLARIILFMGTENMPYRQVRADTLIKNQGHCRQGAINVRRNTAEMFVQSLTESSYRSRELLKALEGHSEVLLSDRPWQSHKTGDYARYALAMLGIYLHWESHEKSMPRTPFCQGVAHDWRVEVGPFGRCANIIKKEPEELLWHKDWSYEKYGLRARNRAHANREVIDVVPASANGWQESRDEEGRIVLTRTFTLAEDMLQNPYLKLKWNRDIEILINDVPVRRKLGSLADFGAVHIPEEACKTLEPGDNTLVVRTVGKADTLNVSAGLIDWRLP